MLSLHRVNCVRPRNWRKWTRCFSSRPALERLTLTRTGSHEFSIDIHAARNSQQDAVVLYFPRGPLLPDAEADHQAISALKAILDCHIVQVNYNFDHLHQHPCAVYDAVSAFDWSVENLLPSKSTTFKKASRAGRVGVCGDLVGGTLATVLALTECRSGQPGVVVAAAVRNPIFDWFDLEGIYTAKKRSKKKSQIDNAMEGGQPSLEQLIEARQKLFRRPTDWIDPFASPIMFFRSAGAALPKTTDVDPEMEGGLYYDEEIHGENATSVPNASVDQRVESVVRYSRQFPARALGLQLPIFKVLSDQSPILKSQAEELVSQLRASVIRQGKARTGLRNRWSKSGFYDHDEQDLMEEVEEMREQVLAEERIQHQVSDSAFAESKDAAMDKLASWLKQQLQK